MRSLGRRVFVYWSAATLLPLAAGVSLSAASLAITTSRGLVGAGEGRCEPAVRLLAFTLLAVPMTAMFRFVPNTHVRWRHALAGGLFVAIAFEGAKRALAWYLLRVPSYSLVYGAFATVPIFLLWIYMSWLIVLFGAVIAAYAPSLQSHMQPLSDSPGARFGLARRDAARAGSTRARAGARPSAEQLWKTLRIDPLQVESLLDTLVEHRLGRAARRAGRRALRAAVRSGDNARASAACACCC